MPELLPIRVLILRLFAGCFLMATLLLKGNVRAETPDHEDVPDSDEGFVEEIIGDYFRFSGNIGLFWDMYQYSAFSYDDFRPRFPDQLGRFSAHAVIEAGRHFQMPFGIDISTRQNNYYLPNLPEERFIDYVQNPRNHISINPSYRWIRAFLGTQTPNFSALTTGDIPIFGAGLELSPGRFLVGVHYGRSQAAINADPLNDIAGAWEQRIFAARIGLGREDGTRLMLNLVHLKDDTLSVSSHPLGIQPREGFSFSPLLQIRLSKSLMLTSETAGSVYTRNLMGPALPFDNDLVEYIEQVQSLNATTHADFSNISSLAWKSESLSLAAEVRYIGPGFEPVGFRAMERDLIDYNLKGQLSLFRQRLVLGGTAGVRTNNLQDITMESTRRFIANGHLFGQLSEALSVQASYANFGFRNNVIFDTLRVEMIQQVFSVSPSLRISRPQVMHVITAGGSMQVFDEWNVFSGAFTATRSMNANAGYNMSFLSMPLQLGLNGMYLDNQTPQASLNILHLALNARYQLFDKKLSPALILSWSNIEREGFTADQRLRLNLRTDYRIRQGLDLRLIYTWSNYTYGSSRPDAVTHEHRFQLSLNQRIG